VWSDLVGLLLSPPACAACDADVAAGVAFCAACAATVERGGPDGDPFAPFAFGGAIAVAIRRLKYDDRPDLAGPLSRLVAAACVRAGLVADLVVPVPLHPRRLAERGYNQAALLAEPIARSLGARHLARGLVRRIDTPRQADLDRAARLENVRDAFSVRDDARVRAKRVLLIDDVATTGATLRACRGPLLEAGAAAVRAVVVARTPAD
jgi:ComF family protein